MHEIYKEAGINEDAAQAIINEAVLRLEKNARLFQVNEAGELVVVLDGWVVAKAGAHELKQDGFYLDSFSRGDAISTGGFDSVIKTVIGGIRLTKALLKHLPEASFVPEIPAPAQMLN